MQNDKEAKLIFYASNAYLPYETDTIDAQLHVLLDFLRGIASMGESVLISLESKTFHGNKIVSVSYQEDYVILRLSIGQKNDQISLQKKDLYAIIIKWVTLLRTNAEKIILIRDENSYYIEGEHADHAENVNKEAWWKGAWQRFAEEIKAALKKTLVYRAGARFVSPIQTQKEEKDSMNIERVSIMKEIKESYVAKVTCNGFVKTSTFFPSSWSRKKVIDKIFEALNDKDRLSETRPNGEYIIRGRTKCEELIIEILYDPMSNTIKTAYPWMGQFK